MLRYGRDFIGGGAADGAVFWVVGAGETVAAGGAGKIVGFLDVLSVLE